MVLIGEANRVVATKKIVLIGDENCGKTCLVSTFAHGQFNVAIETVPLKVDDYLQVQLKIIAAKGGEEYARLRPLNYPDTDVVILCFDIGDPDTLDNVEHRWISEVKHYMAAPILLVGCKLDLRNDPETLAMLARRRSQPVTFEEGTAMATKIGAHAFLECSARDGIGHRAIFELAARVALSLDRSRRERSSSSSTGRLNRSFSRKGF
ncbi:GTP-binding protein of the rho subfamily of ras-like protein [Zopfochytrium polystomum]|nr:GTP-binding protein of the rho subfamily of ras-like protein [Zopfochytrium polystomum]